MELDQKIEAVLFYRAEPMSAKELAKLLKAPEGNIADAARKLSERLGGTGLRLLEKDGEYMLGTAPEAGKLIEEIAKEELSKDLSKASLETLSIILYKGSVTRGEIDHIRGVNSTFILRNLQIRGLVERIENPKDQRSFLYRPTFQLFEYMGIARPDELPKYAETVATLDGFVAAKVAQENAPASEATEARGAIATDVAREVADTDADIAEEDEAIGEFDDTLLAEHREKDKQADV